MDKHTTQYTQRVQFSSALPEHQSGGRPPLLPLRALGAAAVPQERLAATHPGAACGNLQKRRAAANKSARGVGTMRDGRGAGTAGGGEAGQRRGHGGRPEDGVATTAIRREKKMCDGEEEEKKRTKSFLSLICDMVGNFFPTPPNLDLEEHP